MRRKRQLVEPESQLAKRIATFAPEVNKFLVEAEKLCWNVRVDDTEPGLLSAGMLGRSGWLEVVWRLTPEGNSEVVELADEHGPLSGLDEAHHKLQLPRCERCAAKRRRRLGWGRGRVTK